MSMQYVCDRCGNTQYFKYRYYMSVFDVDIDLDTHKDICDDCKASLERWLNEKTK